jgi:hypothetical protein
VASRRPFQVERIEPEATVMLDETRQSASTDRHNWRDYLLEAFPS